MSKAVTVGMPILFFAAGEAAPMAGHVAGIDPTGRVNIAFTDSQGASRSRQGVPFTDKPNAGGDYVVANPSGDATAATEAHAKAMKAGFHGVPTTGNMKQGGKDAAPGDFSSATLSSNNVQPAGSGGPFDPANTSKAHMSAHQTLESQSEGNPTTGGMTPTVDPSNPAQLSERDRETAQAIVNAKGGDEKVRLANGGTGRVSPGNAQAIVDAQKKPRTIELPPAAPATIAFPNAETTRIERNKKLHDEALEKSKTITAERERDARASKVPAQKAVKKVATAKKSKR